MKKIKTNEKGFTLIEVIVTLILVGITSALAGMFIVSVVNGYIFARTNAVITQKAQLAMTRLAKEFTAIQTVDANTANTNGTKITYTRGTGIVGGTLSTVPVVLTLSAPALQLNVNSAGVQTLTDSVSSIALKYCNSPTIGTEICATSWSSASRVIEMTLTLTAGNNTPVAFTRRVTPRNL